MKNTTLILCRNMALTAGVVLTALVSNGVHGQLSATTPPEIVKPVPLSELKNADAVFNELDLAGRGYVTREDTKELIGFGEAFLAVDAKGSGKLTREQFRKAWALYKSANN
ncbi:EF-hand domain-containing protein [Dechloromonas denitrificans]|nr:EF-hand domain-containing protein [Dechloromonas denitrificans]